MWTLGGTHSCSQSQVLGTFGMYKGSLTEERFDEFGGLLQTNNYKQSDYASMAPIGKDIHRIVNKSSKPAISLHFYGINGLVEASVFNTFKQTS